MTPEQQKEIIARESAWIDQSFSSLDLTAYPALNELPPEHSPDDGKFARAYGDTALRRSAADLRQFVSDPDIEALDETGNQSFMADVRDQRAERIVMEFKRRCPDYLPTDSNFQSMVTTLAYNSTLTPSEQHGDDVVDLLIQRGYWTVANLQAVYDALDREGLLDKPAGEPRNLSERERLRVARLAQAGQLDRAIGEFLRCSLDGDEPDMEMIHDPRYRGLCDDAVLFVFEASQSDYVPTPARQAFLLRYAAKRPLTLQLLQQGWRACQDNEKKSERGLILDQMQTPQPFPVTEAQIDSLDDSAVDRLYHDSLRAYADSIRRAPGVLQ